MDENEQGSLQGDKAAEVPGAAGLVCPFPAVAARGGPAPRAAASSAPIHSCLSQTPARAS
jgi:hypothetical protein